MCGIYGYVAPSKDFNSDAAKNIIEGLKRLEYRGYDSWGVAVVDDGKIEVAKKTGSIGDLEKEHELPESYIGIGHTRWATHGGITTENAHPHYSTDGSFVLAQNGIVQNYIELKKDLLEKGYEFKSETDTEVIVRLVEEKLKTALDLKSALRSAFLELHGRNTVILLTSDGSELIAARNGSPLVVGVNEETGEIYFSSDTLSFSSLVQKIIVVDNGQMVHYKSGEIKLFDIKSNDEIEYKLQDLDVEDSKVDKEGYDHFMIKEINESPEVIKQIAKQNSEKLYEFVEAIKSAKNIYTIGSGTAGLAASQTAFYLREISNLKATFLVGAEATEYYDLIEEGDVFIAPSQSGETADVLEVLEIAKEKGAKIATLVNMQGATMTRISDFPFMAQAGPEICVMSTKVFVAQIAWGYLLAKAVNNELENGISNLEKLSTDMSKFLSNEVAMSSIKNLAKNLVDKKDIFLLGKSQNMNIVKEGMVKIIEGSYRHAHAMPAGDLKHYAITLMEKGVPVIVAISNDEAKSDVINAANEVKARGAEVFGIASENHESFSHFIQVPDTEAETSGIMNVIALQLLAYYMTVELGNNVDKPRNIAKSVTVK